MLFSSIIFLFAFLPIVVLTYIAVPHKIKNYVLLAASLIFYSWGEPLNVFLMIFSIAFNYSMALDIDRETDSKKRYSLIFTIAVNLLILSFFKYYGFIIDTFNGVFRTEITYTALPLPIGISFYTFQAMSYIIDVYRGNARAQKDPFKFGLYLSLFPQLIAGPIVKYRDIAEQLESRTFTMTKAGEGAQRFIIGLSKKVILANSLGALHNLILELSADNSSVFSFWIGALAYTLQIYYDFSGYSDMAIGLGKIFGFDFIENFDHPYISKSVTEFWRRWHISLNTWFREYLYIPLGGNRVSPGRHIFNLFIVWALTGLWHGASWNFVVWGIYYCILLIIEKYFLSSRIERLNPIAANALTFIIVLIGWVFFFSSDIAGALKYLKAMFFMSGIPLVNMQLMYILKTNFMLLMAGLMLSGNKAKKIYDLFSKQYSWIPFAITGTLFFISLAYLIFSSYNPFLYFRF